MLCSEKSAKTRTRKGVTESVTAILPSKIRISHIVRRITHFTIRNNVTAAIRRSRDFVTKVGKFGGISPYLAVKCYGIRNKNCYKKSGVLRILAKKNPLNQWFKGFGVGWRCLTPVNQLGFEPYCESVCYKE